MTCRFCVGSCMQRLDGAHKRTHTHTHTHKHARSSSSSSPSPTSSPGTACAACNARTRAIASVGGAPSCAVACSSNVFTSASAAASLAANAARALLIGTAGVCARVARTQLTHACWPRCALCVARTCRTRARRDAAAACAARKWRARTPYTRLQLRVSTRIRAFTLARLRTPGTRRHSERGTRRSMWRQSCQPTASYIVQSMTTRQHTSSPRTYIYTPAPRVCEVPRERYAVGVALLTGTRTDKSCDAEASFCAPLG